MLLGTLNVLLAIEVYSGISSWIFFICLWKALSNSKIVDGI